MENSIQKFRQSSILSEKLVYFSEKLRTNFILNTRVSLNEVYIYRSSHRDVVCKNDVVKNFANSQENICVGVCI